MEYRVNKGWWEEYQYSDINKFRKDDVLNNVKGYFTMDTCSNLAYIPTGRNAHRSLADIIVEHYKKAFGIHVAYRNVSDGSRRHPHISTYLDCHVVDAPKWLRQNEDGTYTIISVRDYLTACNRMVENVCKECAKNHLNAGKLFGFYVESMKRDIFIGREIAFPFGIDCDRMIQQRKEEERKRKAELEAHRIRQKKCNEMCRDKLNNTISNAKDIYAIVKRDLTTAEVKEVVFYWDSYSRHEGYKITIQIADDVEVCINALKCEKYVQFPQKRCWYSLSDELLVHYKYEDCTSYKTEYNVLRDLILTDVQMLNDIKRKMNITRWEVKYPEEVSHYVNKNWWRTVMRG